MCKNAGLLLGWDFQQKRVLIARGDCKGWDCPECAIKQRDKWVLRAQIGTRELIGEGLKVDFVTITSHESLKTFSQCDFVWKQAWSKLYAALKRKTSRLEYFIVPERHKDGRMHVHALWSANVTKKWLKDNARKRGLGHQADVKHVLDSSAASRYVTKYVGKDLGTDLPDGFRRVRTHRAAFCSKFRLSTGANQSVTCPYHVWIVSGSEISLSVSSSQNGDGTILHALSLSVSASNSAFLNISAVVSRDIASSN